MRGARSRKLCLISPKEKVRQNDLYKTDSSAKCGKGNLAGATAHSREVMKTRVQNCITLVSSLIFCASYILFCSHAVVHY